MFVSLRRLIYQLYCFIAFCSVSKPLSPASRYFHGSCSFCIPFNYYRSYDRKHSYPSQRKSNKMQPCTKIFIPYVYEAQHVSGDTPPIIKSLKLHYQPLDLHAWKVVGRVVAV